MLLGVPETATPDSIQYFHQGSANIDLRVGLYHLLLKRCYFFDLGSEDEHIVLSYFLHDLNIGSIERSYDDTSVHDKFHVGGS